MPKKNNFRWTTKSKAAFGRKVGQFNSKRTRLLKKNPALEAYLPERIDVNDLRLNIASRETYRENINRINRFLQKGSEKFAPNKDGILATRFEVWEERQKVNKMNRLREEELKRVNPTTEKGTMGTIRENHLQPKKFDFYNMKKANWEKFKRTVDKQIAPDYYSNRNESYKQNYLKAFDAAYEGVPGAEETRQRIVNIPAATLVDMYYSDPDLQIDFHYELQEAKYKLKQLNRALDKYFGKAGEKDEDS